MFTLKSETKQNIREIVGYDIFEEDLDFDEEISLIEQKIGKAIEFPNEVSNSKRIGRGNPLLARNKIKTMEDVDRSLAKIK